MGKNKKILDKMGGFGRKFFGKTNHFQPVSSELCLLLPKNRKEAMTATEMNAELFRDLSIIAEDEGLMKKALKAIRRIAAQKRAMDETEYLMSSPAMAEIIRQGQEDIKNGKGRVVKLEDLYYSK